MGVNVSKQQQESYTNYFTQFTNSIVTNFVNNSSNSVQSYKVINVKLDNGAAIVCGKGDFVLGQSSDNKMSALLTAKSQATNDISAKITNEIKTLLASATEQSNKGLPILQTNVNISDQKVVQNITNLVNTAVSTTISNSMTQSLNDTQVINFNVDSSMVYIKDGCVKIDQASTIQMFSQMLTDNIAQNLISNYSDNKADTSIDSKTKQSNELTLPFLFGFGALGFIGVIIVGIIIYSMVKGTGGKNGGGSGGNTKAAMKMMKNM